MLEHISFRTRRILSLALTATALGLVGGLAWIADTRLAHASFLTGGALLAAILLLMLLGLRRRLPILPLGSVSVWTQTHLYLGLFAAGVYALHVPALIANGVFEAGLSIAFLVVTASGLYGIYASRTIPKRLTAIELQPRFDQVAWHREQIAAAAVELLQQLHEPASTAVLGGYYGTSLRPYFTALPSMPYLFAPQGTRRRRLLAGLAELDRYLDIEGRDAAGRLAALVRRRDDLDYQFALQLRLRLWIVFHSTFSLILLAGSLLHVVLVWRFHAT